MNADENSPDRSPVDRSRRVGGWRRRVIGALLASSALIALVIVNIPDRLPDRLWTHPGMPWCENCVDGVPRWTYRLAPGGPECDVGWCFGYGSARGIELGPPPTFLQSVVTDIEATFRNGDHGYYGGVSYVPTGCNETVDGHHWTEYRRAAER